MACYLPLAALLIPSPFPYLVTGCQCLNDVIPSATNLPRHVTSSHDRHEWSELKSRFGLGFKEP